MKPEHDYEAARVYLDNPEDLIFRTEETEPEHFAFQTITLQPGQTPGPQTILALDPLRKDAALISVDAPFVLCDSAMQAINNSNYVTGFPSPAGAYIAQGQPVSLSGTAQVWGACQAATRIVVILNRRSKI